MTGRALWSAMQQAYASRQQDNRIEASIEIVYGHAWKATPEKRDANSSRDFAPIRWQLRPGAAK